MKIDSSISLLAFGLLGSLRSHAFVVQQTSHGHRSMIGEESLPRCMAKKMDLLDSSSTSTTIHHASAVVSTSNKASPTVSSRAPLAAPTSQMSLTKMEQISTDFTTHPTLEASVVASISTMTPSPPVQQEEEIVAVGTISHHEALDLLLLREKLGRRGGKGKNEFFYHDGVSLDLGRSETMVVVSHKGISLPIRGRRAGPVLIATWEELEEIVTNFKNGQVGCYALYADGHRPWRISTISLRTGRAATLLPAKYVKGPPTVVLGSFLMHRLGGGKSSFIGPAEDTRRKLDAIKMKKVYGKVLDTTTGLGYTAIAAARCSHVSEVVTCEVDDASMELCRQNPWSSELFSKKPSNGRCAIHIMEGDICDLVQQFGDSTFAAVMHDPPAISLCKTSNLYATSFYAELYRVLRWRGRLFHFVGGHPKDKENGRLYKSVVQRLESVGFKKVMILASAQGIVAEKGEDRKSKKGRLFLEREGRKKGRYRGQKSWSDDGDELPPLLDFE